MGDIWNEIAHSLAQFHLFTGLGYRTQYLFYLQLIHISKSFIRNTVQLLYKYILKMGSVNCARL